MSIDNYQINDQFELAKEYSQNMEIEDNLLRTLQHLEVN